MRVTRSMAPSLLLAAAALLVSCGPQQPPVPAGPRATHRVDLAVACIGDSVSFTLSPWYLRVARGDTVEWHMNVTAGQVDRFDIERTPRGRWPWKNRIRGIPGRPAASPEINPVSPGAYRYQIAFECSDARTNRRHNVVIDPDIWLD